MLECLTAQDVNGETALHSAASSKASGFARFYAKLLTNGSQILQQSTKDVLELLDLGYIQVAINTVIMFSYQHAEYVYKYLYTVGCCYNKR